MEALNLFLFASIPGLFVTFGFISFFFVGPYARWYETKKTSKWLKSQFQPPEHKSNAKGYIETAAYFIAEGQRIIDGLEEYYLLKKKRPARKAAEIVATIKREKAKLNKSLLKVEGELEYLSGLFPMIMEAREHLVEDDSIADETDGSDIDPIKRFISPEEFKNLKSWEKSDLALQRYIDRRHSKLEVGKMYERYLGYLYESDGWDVEFKGLVEGYDDLGRDLICRNGTSVEIVQAKCWSAYKDIRENVVFQLYASMFHYGLSEKNVNSESVKAVLAVTTSLSDVALQISESLGIDVRTIPLAKDYPMIKCNIGREDERIYHLPFDQQYDRIKIEPERGEKYVKSAKEAESSGFRRAFRWRWTQED